MGSNTGTRALLAGAGCDDAVREFDDAPVTAPLPAAWRPLVRRAATEPHRLGVTAAAEWDAAAAYAVTRPL